MKILIVNIIKLYQKTISPDHGFLGRFVFAGACRFDPTCSQYTKEAVERYGSTKGLFLGLKRVLRCQPFAKGGFDPVS